MRRWIVGLVFIAVLAVIGTRGVFFLAWALTGCSGDSPGSGEPASVAATDDAASGFAQDVAAEQEPPEVWATLDEITAPYFAEGEAAAAARDFAAGNWKRARQQFAAHLERSELADGADAARVRLLIAVCDARLQQWDAAARGFVEAAEQLPILADYLSFEAARARMNAGDRDAAIELAGRVAADSIHAMDARLVAGEALRGQKRWAEVAEHYRRYLDDFPRGKQRSEARYRLAEALERVDRAVPDAVDQHRRITVVDARSRWGKLAKKRVKAILGRLPRRDARKHRALAAGDYIELGMARYRKKQHRKAIAEFERALAAPAKTAVDTCTASYHLADSWFRHRERERATRLFDAAWERCKEAAEVDYQVKAGYLAGRAFAILGDWSAAAERFARTEEVAAANDHSYADDARVFQAEAKAMLDDKAASRALLAEVAKLYPDGDKRTEALWRLAWTAYRDEDYPVARQWLEQVLDSPSLDPDRKAHSQAQYWMGRVYGHMGDAAASATAYITTVRAYPLTYYALLALNRLREHHPGHYRSLIEELDASANERRVPEELLLRPRILAEDPSGQRMIEFLRLGLRDRAEAEIAGAGRKRPTRGAAIAPAHIEAMWTRALTYHRAGRYPRAVWITRWHAVDYKRRWPVGNDRIKWEIAYPRGFRELIEEHAESYGYPSALQMAIVREESGFYPRLESWANAIGLSQLIKSTAKRFGQQIGVRASRRNLLDPEKNLAIGARFLAYLWKLWNQRVGLVPPSYNAGEGAVRRWIVERGELPFDEWIEAILGDQARGYSKRVLASYFVYSYLADRTIPVLSNDPPGGG